MRCGRNKTGARRTLIAPLAPCYLWHSSHFARERAEGRGPLAFRWRPLRQRQRSRGCVRDGDEKAGDRNSTRADLFPSNAQSAALDRL
jgi:hypothetical protein